MSHLASAALVGIGLTAYELSVESINPTFLSIFITLWYYILVTLI